MSHAHIADSGKRPNLRPLGPSAIPRLRILPGQNVGFFFDSDEDHRVVLRDFILDGLERGEKILYLTARRSEEQLRECLELPESVWRAPDQISFVPAFTPVLPLDRPLIDIFTQNFQEQLRLARQQGYSGLRLTSERVFSLEFLAQPQERVAFKRQIQALVLEQNCEMICQYDLRLLDNAALLDLLSAHPRIIFGRQFHENFYFVPFSCEQSGRSQITLRNCLKNLQDRSRADLAIQTRVNQQALVAELGRDALAGMAVEELMAKVVRSVAGLLDGCACRVLELVPDGRLMQVRVSHGWGEVRNEPDATLCSPRTLEGFSLLEASHPVFFPGADPGRLEICPPLPEKTVAQAACVAIPGQPRPFGVLGIYGVQDQSFGREDLLFLQSVANVLAVAIERQRADREIQHLAYYDVLTGLPNRSLLIDRLERALSRARRNGHETAVMFLDLDRFKSINDTLGHACGDKLLQITGERLVASVRHTDTVARLGGDEFVVVLAELDREEGAAGVAQKILQALAGPVQLDDQEVFITTSIGIAVFPEDGTEPGILLRHADIAMYQAKERGKNTYQFFSLEMNARVQERMRVETSLRKALERDELFLLYQPQLDLRTGRMVGMEALLRWNHPELGVLTPEKFIGIAEETGLILSIGQWVLASACRQANEWKNLGFPAMRLAVNISARQFNHPCFIDMIDHVLAETGFDPACLELELTESTIMENADVTIMTLTDIKVRGINLAIDDFGTGYSSLSYLKHFPFDRLKIAQSFVRDVTSDVDNAAIVDAVIAVAHSLNIKVIAEGVETRHQLEFLIARQCDELQGFYFGRPTSVEHFTDLLRAGFALKDICPYQAPPQIPPLT
ncbi:EAL domain-containing protein [Geoalkalibacter sp.]|uniref:EAL domain-containing protein n=1 Tax=Geoalkalibacter sp. TaxID=3041440 RepID=UPI00272DC9B1|nr:EAL domain-containing protein [Geoalkalibacter sp.]